MDSWQQLFEYRLLVSPPYEPDATASTAHHEGDWMHREGALAPTHVLPDSALAEKDRILTRCLDALRRGLETHSDLAFPNDKVQDRLRRFEKELAKSTSSETSCHMQFSYLFDAVEPILQSIFERCGRGEVQARNYFHTRSAPWRGNALDTQITGKDSRLSTSISVKLERPTTLFRYGAERHGSLLQQERLLDALGSSSGAGALATTLAFQMLSAKPNARFGLFYAGHIFVLTESAPHPSGSGMVLIVSPLFTGVGSYGRLPTAPLLACLTALCCQDLDSFKIERISGDTPLPLRKAPYIPEGINQGDKGSDQENQDMDHKQGQCADDKKFNIHSFVAMMRAKSKCTKRGELSFDLGRQLGHMFLCTIKSKPAMTVAYNIPGLSDRPRFVVPVTFVSKPPGTTMEERHLNLSEAYRSITSFLMSYHEDISMRPPHFSIQASLILPPDRIVLGDRLGEGRTGTVYRVVRDPESQYPPLVAKVFSCRHIASVVRETLFYEAVFASLKTSLPVPKFYGTYASVCSGWYVMLLEDVGTPVEGLDDMILTKDEKLAKDIRKLKRAFKKAGIDHGDVRSPNVLRAADDGALRFVDFGYSRLAHIGSA